MKQGWSSGIPPAASQNAPESVFGDLLEVSFKTVAGEGGLKKADVQGDGPSKEDKDEKGLNVVCALAYLMEDPQAMGLVAADMAGLAAQTLPKEDGVLTDQTIKGRAASIVLNQDAGQAQDPANLKAVGMHGKVQEQVLKTALNAQAGEQAAPPGRSSADVLQASKADKAQNITAVQAQAADKILQAKELDADSQESLQKRFGEFQDHLENARIKVPGDKPGDDKENYGSISPAAFGLEHRSQQLQRTEGVEAAVPQELPQDPSGEDGAAKQVGKATLQALRDGASEYRIQLHPEGLGRVEVTLVAQHKMISLSMRTDNELARALILDHAGDLRAEMNTQDYQLGALNVHVGTDSQNSAGFMASFGDQARQGIEARRGESGHDAQSAQTQAASQEIRRRYVSSNVINYRI